MNKVLIVDDDFISLEVLKAMLSQYPLDIHTATNGPDAIELATQIHPELIILDYEMPTMTGAEACLQLRLQPEFKNIPILALTGHQSSAELNACRDAGMNQTLYKPVSPEVLAEAIATYLPGLAK